MLIDVIPGLEELNHPEMVDQVRRGMQILDVNRPGWEKLVYLPDLDICSSTTCVLGQVYRDGALYEPLGFLGAVYYLFNIVWSRTPSDDDYQQLVDHGFAVSQDYYQEGESAKLQLERVWKVLIEQRGVTND